MENKSEVHCSNEDSGVGEQNNKVVTMTEDNHQDAAIDTETIEKSGDIPEKVGISDTSKQNQRRRRKRGGVAWRDRMSNKKPNTEKRLQDKEPEGSQKNQKGEEGSEKNQKGEEGSEKNQKGEEDTEKRSQSKEHAGSEKNQKGKQKYDIMERRKNEERKKLGGMIFMCNAKTKPDCFRYRVMGVPQSKKDLVMGVKPGLKIFLYDFDLKLMYGVYKTSSSGGMKLEPKAFGGSFPIQVRFEVHKDCYPLAENIFKKAIRENYDERNKFKTELSPKQVRKLMELFQPASVYSTALPIRSPPSVAARHDRQAYGVKESGLDFNWERSGRDPFANNRNHGVRHLEVEPTHKEHAPRDLFISEKEYRAHGLIGERRNLTAQDHLSPTFDPYQRDYDRNHVPRHSDAGYVSIPLQREVLRTDPQYLTEREYQTHDLGVRRELPHTGPPANASLPVAAFDPYKRDLYQTHRYDVSSGDPHLTHYRRDTYLSASDPIPNREIDLIGRSYSTYSAHAVPDHNRMLRYQETKPGVPGPVSSRYSFAGPSFSLR